MIKSKQLIFSNSRRCLSSGYDRGQYSQPRTLKAQTPCCVEHFSFHLDQSTEQKKLQKCLTNPFKWTISPDQAQSPKKARYPDIKFKARVILLIFQSNFQFFFFRVDNPYIQLLSSQDNLDCGPRSPSTSLQSPPSDQHSSTFSPTLSEVHAHLIRFVVGSLFVLWLN